MILTRAATKDDLPELLAILCVSLQAAGWTEQDLRGSLVSPVRKVLVAENAGRVAGLLIATCPLEDEAEILVLAVDPPVRRRGLARALLKAFLRGRQGTVHLEVRISNLAARLLYAGMGFQIAGTRAAYYRDPVEDAVLMTKVLNNQ